MNNNLTRNESISKIVATEKLHILNTAIYSSINTFLSLSILYFSKIREADYVYFKRGLVNPPTLIRGRFSGNSWTDLLEIDYLMCGNKSVDKLNQSVLSSTEIK